MLNRLTRRLLPRAARMSRGIRRASFASQPTFTVNECSYSVPEAGEVLVGMCLDGTEPDYLHAAMQAGCMPNLTAILEGSFTAQRTHSDQESAPPAFFRPSGAMDGEQPGSLGIAAACMPTFTNPNNVAIMCGAPPDVTGISGNFFLDQDSGEEVYMDKPDLIRADSVFAALQNAGADVTVVTAKHKLLNMLSHQLRTTRSHQQSDLDSAGRVVALSVEKMAPEPDAEQAARLDHSGTFDIAGKGMYVSTDVVGETQDGETRQQIDKLVAKIASTDASSTPLGLVRATDRSHRFSEVPGIYDPMCSLYAMRVGLEVLRTRTEAAEATGSTMPPQIMYLSTTDYVQHKHAPGEPVANHFYEVFDGLLGEFHAMGAKIAFTADHGMNDKFGYTQEPKIVYLQSLLDQEFLSGDGMSGWSNEDREDMKGEIKVILPITDPYVAHHGQLGSYATIYVKSNPAFCTQDVIDYLRDIDGLYTVMGKEDAAEAFQLPLDRIGDIVVVGQRDTVVGKTPLQRKLLEGLKLRSHGGLTEVEVPFFANFPLSNEYASRLTRGKTRTFHLFDFLCNGA